MYISCCCTVYLFTEGRGVIGSGWHRRCDLSSIFRRHTSTGISPDWLCYKFLLTIGYPQQPPLNNSAMTPKMNTFKQITPVMKLNAMSSILCEDENENEHLLRLHIIWCGKKAKTKRIFAYGFNIWARFEYRQITRIVKYHYSFHGVMNKLSFGEPRFFVSPINSKSYFNFDLWPRP